MTDLIHRIETAPEPSLGYKVEPGFKDEPMHTWWLKGEQGAVHIWARIARLEGWPSEWIGGVEVHYAKCPGDNGWFKPDEPSHAECWLLEGPCWHDGTSLYFREQIAPCLPHPENPECHMRDNLPHFYIEHILRDWFHDKFSSRIDFESER